MKKLTVLFCALLFSGLIAFAEEPTALQTTEIDCTGLAAVINKQPENNAMTQKVSIRRSGLILVVNINGKVEIPQKEQQKETK